MDIDDAFQGHRFCEPAKSQRAQRLNSWFFTFNVFTNDKTIDPNAPDSNIDCDLDNDDRCGDTLDPSLAPYVIGDGQLHTLDGARTRPFHPKKDGHRHIEIFLKQSIKAHFEG